MRTLLLGLTLLGGCETPSASFEDAPPSTRTDNRVGARFAGRVEWTENGAFARLYFTDSAPVGEVDRIVGSYDRRGSHGWTIWGSEPVLPYDPWWVRWVDATTMEALSVTGAAVGTLAYPEARTAWGIPPDSTVDTLHGNLVRRSSSDGWLHIADLSTSAGDIPALGLVPIVEPPEVIEPLGTAEYPAWINETFPVRWTKGPGIIVICLHSRYFTTYTVDEHHCEVVPEGETTHFMSGGSSRAETGTLSIHRVVEGEGYLTDGIIHDVASTATTVIPVQLMAHPN